jgi:hypothetical protein
MWFVEKMAMRLDIDIASHYFIETQNELKQ